MKLDRNTNPDGRGKYALLLLRKMRSEPPKEVQNAIDILFVNGIIDPGATPDTDFFVIRMKDKYASAALQAYADAVASDDVEYANEIYELAKLAANHPNKQRPT